MAARSALCVTTDVIDRLQAAHTRANIILLDACRSDDHLRDEEPAEGVVTRAGRGLRQEALLPLPRLAPQTITGFACNIGMSALDGQRGGNGLYTRALLDSLKEQRSAASTKVVNWLALANKFVMDRTAAMARDGSYQIPSFSGSLTPELLELTI